MRTLSRFSALLVFACASALADVPTDSLTVQIGSAFAPRTAAPAVAEGISSASRTQTGRLASWDVSAKFLAAKGEWVLVGYELKRSVSTTKEEGDPVTPNNPQAPTGGGNIGDTASNTLHLGSWEYEFHYTYGVRDGVLGWHLDWMHATYKPAPKPVNIPQ